MTDAPEEMWAQKTAGRCGWDEPIATRFEVRHFPKYIRADIHEALEAENKRLERQVAFLGEKTLDLALELDAVNTKLRTALEDNG